MFQYPVQLDHLEIINLYSRGDLSQTVDPLFGLGQKAVFPENFVVWGNDKLETFFEVSNIYHV